MTQWIIWLAIETEAAKPEGGMFDFDATLPVMMVQLLVLMLILNAVFYKPLIKVLDERKTYIQSNFNEAEKCLEQTAELTTQYEAKITDARQNALKLTNTTRSEIQKFVSEKLEEAQKKADSELATATNKLELQKDEALKSLESEVENLSSKILEKLGIQKTANT
uniref:ATP synthase CF0 B' subunit n=1 Tax=Cyanophora sudae TaxID=1522369 RepID=A0A2Z4HFX0_9EUKA|nr:ATP synthase CF0 B' subunit [Cyanophora sudae]AWW13669.1 ATP synthase CF0 B' subunit [Cyanophora sudae]